MTSLRRSLALLWDAVLRRPDFTLAVGWVAVGASLILIPVSVWLTLSGSVDSGTLTADRALSSAIGLTSGPVGLLIAVRRRENAVAWILIWLGLAVEVVAATGNAAKITADPGMARMIGIIGDASWIAILTLLCALVLLYPDGHLPSRRWRPLGWALLGWLALFVATVTLWEVAAPTSLHGGAPLPPGSLGALAQLSLGAAAVLVPPLMLAVGAAVVVRWRRARGVERQQLALFAYMAVVIVLGWMLNALALPGPWLALQDVALAGLPVAIAVAIFRYRLYDIDVVVERTLVYGATTAAIGAAFVIGIVVLQTALRPITGGSELAVAASTLLCFALFQPIRRRMQSTVDQRFYRSRYDSALTLDAFTSRLAGEVDLDAVGAELADAVTITMRPAHVSLWLRDRDVSGARNVPRTPRA